MSKVERKPVAAWVELGAWHKGPGAPNGSVAGCMQRHCVEVVVYLADYYGRGEKLYLDASPLLQCEGEYAPRRVYGGSNDGNVERIRARAASAGVELSA